MIRRLSAATAFVGAAIAGVAGGWWLAMRHDSGYRRSLFSSRPHRRFAALGWLARNADPESLPLLRDYLAWEPIPALRSRARRIVITLQAVL
ncbi:MAG: hypothetical protein ACRELE_03275 [Gemmatimonadales bacterium]